MNSQFLLQRIRLKRANAADAGCDESAAPCPRAPCGRSRSPTRGEPKNLTKIQNISDSGNENIVNNEMHSAEIEGGVHRTALLI